MAQVNYWVVVDTTGEIVGSITGDTTIDSGIITNNVAIGHTAYAQVNGDTAENTYYPTGTRTTRPLFSTANTWNKTSILANGTDTATFGSSLPNPTDCVVSFIGVTGTVQRVLQSQTIIDGSLSINTSIPGTYVVNLSAFPYQSYTQTITAT